MLIVRCNRHVHRLHTNRGLNILGSRWRWRDFEHEPVLMLNEELQYVLTQLMFLR